MYIYGGKQVNYWKYNKKIITILFLCINIFLLTACESEVNDANVTPPDSNIDCIIYEGEVLYTVVRSDTSSKAVTEAAVALRRYIQDNTESEIKITTDWVKNTEKVEEVRGEYEILVGLTNRPESIEAYEKFKSADEPLEYMIEKLGNHYIIIGNDDVIMQAVETFMENITVYDNGNTLKVTENINISATKQFPVSKLIIDGLNIKEFKIVYPSDYNSSQRNLATNIQEYIYMATGYTIDIISDNESKSEHEIVIGVSRNTSYDNFNDLDCTIETRDGNLYVGGKNYYADAKAVNYLINDYLYYNMYGKNPIEIELTPSDSKVYEAKPYNYDILA